MVSSDNKRTIEDKLVEWLSGEGYRLEYLAHRAFSQEGLGAVMGTYVESAEGKSREIDVTAYPRESERKPHVFVRVFCECKYSKDRPWILLASNLPAMLWADWTSIPMSKNIQAQSARVDRYADVLHRSWHFAEKQSFAHSLVQGFRPKGRDEAFDALQKIACAAWDYVENAERRGAKEGLVAFPCLVVEAPLYVAWFDYGKDQFMVKSVSYGRVSWAGHKGGTVVDVVHLGALAEYAQAMKITFQCVQQVVADMLHPPVS